MKNEKTRITLAMISMYLIWGSTYLGISIALESLPPLLLAGGRFLAAGAILFAIYRYQGVKIPSLIEWRNAALVGILMLGFGVGAVTFAEQWVASGLAAVSIATVPLWALLFSTLWKERPGKFDWLALIIGFSGVVLLNLENNLRGNPLGAFLLIMAPMCWALGSNLSKHMKLPQGGMGFAAELLSGGVFMVVLGLLHRGKSGCAGHHPLTAGMALPGHVRLFDRLHFLYVPVEENPPWQWQPLMLMSTRLWRCSWVCCWPMSRSPTWESWQPL